MTVSSDFSPEEQSFDAPAYPNVFGITFTPTIIGAILAVVGLAAAGYIFTALVQPELGKNQTLQKEVTDKKGQVEQARRNPEKVKKAQQNLEESKRRRQDVQNLFADETSLDTLLLDINREFTRPGRDIDLLTFTPSVPALFTDPAFGPGVQNKLKGQLINITLRGSFAQTQAILRSLERLQPLIIVRNFTTTRDISQQRLIVDNTTGRTSLVGEPSLSTSLGLQVLVTPTPTPPAPGTPGAPGAAPAKK